MKVVGICKPWLAKKKEGVDSASTLAICLWLKTAKGWEINNFPTYACLHCTLCTSEWGLRENSDKTELFKQVLSERGKTWLCFLPSCWEHFHSKSNQSGTPESWKHRAIFIQLLDSTEIKEIRQISGPPSHILSLCSAFQWEGCSVEAQEEMSGLWPSLSSAGCASNIMGHANKPLMTNTNFSWCHLISACRSKHIKQGVNWDFKQRKCQGVGYKAAKELLPPSPAWGPRWNKAPGILPQCIWVVLRLGQPIPSQPRLWIMLHAGI